MRFILLLAMLGCGVETREVPPTPPEPTFGPPLDGRENQGRHLLGGESARGAADGLDDLRLPSADHYSVSSTAARDGKPVTVSVTGAVVVADDLEGAAGLRFTATTGTSELEILAELPATADEPLRYTLQYRPDTTTSTWIDPCHGDAAVVFKGRFTADGRHVDEAGKLSFACGSGVAFKCVKWGYVPGPTDTAVDDPWDLHEACTRMARADICMTGESFTREGTWIELMDDFGVKSPTPPNMTPPQRWSAWLLPRHTWPPERHTFYLEGGWHDEEAPECLSKVRWASLPPDPCSGSLPDPRIDPHARYCDDYSDDQLSASPALLWNNSLANDLALHTWGNSDGLITTVRGFRDDFVSHPPIPGMTYVGSGGILLREPTAELTALGILDPVRMFCVPQTTRCVVTTPATAPVDHTEDRGFEGYVFMDSPDRPVDTIPLFMYESATDFVTSTTSPGATYTRGQQIGYVFQ